MIEDTQDTAAEGTAEEAATETTVSTDPVAEGNDAPAETPVPADAGSDVLPLEEPFFLVMSPRPSGAYDDLEAATTAAKEVATAHPGADVYILESRRHAESPAPNVKVDDIKQE